MPRTKVLDEEDRVELTEEERKALEEQELRRLPEAELERIARDVGAELAKQPKVRVKIPVDPLNKHLDVVTVHVNGYFYNIKRGVPVEVPKVVADILTEAGYI